MARFPGPLELLATAQEQALALAALPGALVQLAKALRALPEAVQASRDTMLAVRRVALQIEALVAEVQAPVRALTPGLMRVAAALDNPVVDTIPQTVQRVTDDLVPVLQSLRDTQVKITTIASSTERITRLVDDAQGRIAGPVAGLLGMRRPVRTAPAPIDVSPAARD